MVHSNRRLQRSRNKAKPCQSVPSVLLSQNKTSDAKFCVSVLDVGQAVSMAFGVIANIALVMRFLEKWPYESTWVAIGALTFHGKSKSCCPTIHADQIYRTDILQIVIVLTFGIIHSVDDGFVSI